MASAAARLSQPVEIPELHSGDRMSRAEFHRLYELMPPDFRAELIGGIVYVAYAVRRPHGLHHINLTAIVGGYAGNTPGVEPCDNATVMLDDEAEPQPDLFLRILPEYGGQSRTTSDDYIAGAPEWIGEVAHSSRAIDLHAKKLDYQRSGVLEYVVLCVKERELRWFNLCDNAELQPDADGVYRMRTFPGLWINAPALFGNDYKQMMATLHEGLASPEHAEFVKRLQNAKKPKRNRKNR